MPTMSPAGYRIVRQPSGEWRLYRGDQLVDSDQDPERAPMAEIFRWASMVVWAEERVDVLDWVEQRGQALPTYLARTDR